MSKVVQADFRPTNLSKLKEALSDEELSFVLITCSKPSKEGQMNVEMDCDGDEDLLGLMMERAMPYFH